MIVIELWLISEMSLVVIVLLVSMMVQLVVDIRFLESELANA